MREAFVVDKYLCYHKSDATCPCRKRLKVSISRFAELEAHMLPDARTSSDESNAALHREQGRNLGGVFIEQLPRG